MLEIFPVMTALKPGGRASRSRQFVWMGLLWGCFGGIGATVIPPAQAAERIYISYSVLERSIPVSSLEKYARTGTIDEDLELYAQYAKPQELEQLRRALVTRAELSPIAISQFLYSPPGVILLKRLGTVIQSEAGVENFRALRAALILASADADGLTLLNVLKKFPTRGIRIDVVGSLAIAEDLQDVVAQTNQATAAIKQQATAELAEPTPIALFPTADLRQRGEVRWQKQSTTFNDVGRKPLITTLPGVAPNAPIPNGFRGRLIPVDIYLPIEQPSPAPVVVISHGLGGDRNTFAYLAEHLASYGFGVLVLEHPGSNAQQLQSLINGQASGAASPTEFLDRPLDVSFVLDELGRDPNSSLQRRLNLKQVGVLGQSFGGYTALALGGATLNATQLKSDCQKPEDTLNLSLLLQCDAAQLVQANTKLQDQRITAVLAINPVTSAVFGQAGIEALQVPTMIVTGSADTIAPALPEQIRPFTWLKQTDKYLVLLDRGTHFSVITTPSGAASSSTEIALPNEVVGPNPAIARRYIEALSVAFFQTYIAKQPAYQVYLNAAYARSISEAAMPLSQIRLLTGAQLAKP
jgi:predicted dienelactone hydrolase